MEMDSRRSGHVAVHSRGKIVGLRLFLKHNADRNEAKVILILFGVH